MDRQQRETADPDVSPGPFGTFGGELRRWRAKRELSLAGLARLVHYSKGYLSKIENGDKQQEWAQYFEDTVGYQPPCP